MIIKAFTFGLTSVLEAYTIQFTRVTSSTTMSPSTVAIDIDGLKIERVKISSASI